jgi:hypothetical protein
MTDAPTDGRGNLPQTGRKSGCRLLAGRLVRVDGAGMRHRIGMFIRPMGLCDLRHIPMNRQPLRSHDDERAGCLEAHMFGKADFGQIGTMIATNTVLFSGLDLGQWIADKLALWSLPANLLAAVIATLLALALTAAGRTLGVNMADA